MPMKAIKIIARGAPNGKGLEHQSRRVIKAQSKWNNKRKKKVLDVEQSDDPKSSVQIGCIDNDTLD